MGRQIGLRACTFALVKIVATGTLIIALATGLAITGTAAAYADTPSTTRTLSAASYHPKPIVCPPGTYPGWSGASCLTDKTYPDPTWSMPSFSHVSSWAPRPIVHALLAPKPAVAHWSRVWR